MPKIVGIDLGTSNSCMSVMRTGQAVIIPPANDMQRRVTPSVVGYTDDGKIVVGNAARRQWMANPEFTFVGVKRLLGRRFDDPIVTQVAELSPFDVAPGPNGEAMLVGRDNQLIAPEEVLAEIVKKMRMDGEPFLGEPISHCVLTIPAHFDPLQERKAVDAIQRGGIQVVKTMTEPEAAALAYGYTKEVGRVIAVYDFGGGTFDVTIMRVKKRGFDTIGFSGDPFLGGQDFDRILVDWMIENLIAKSDLDVRDNRLSLQRLFEQAEITKEALSESEVESVVIHSLADGTQLKTGALSEVLTREQFEEMTGHLARRTIEPCEEAMRMAKVKPEDIDDVVLIGGMTSMPYVKRIVEEVFGQEGRNDIFFDVAVSMGAAIMGAAAQGLAKGVAINDRLSHSIGLADADGAVHKFLKMNSPLEKGVERMITTAVDDQRMALFDIYEGEREDASALRHVTRIILKDVEPAEAGIAQFRVGMRVDRDGVLTVAVTDNDNPTNEVKREVHTGSGMTRAELEELLAMNT